MALILVFSIGGIAVIASIVRINALYIFQHSTDIPCKLFSILHIVFLHSLTTPDDGIYILIWSQVGSFLVFLVRLCGLADIHLKVEISVAIISASAPALRPFLKSIIGGSSVGKSAYSRTYGGSQQNQVTRNRIHLQSFNGTGREAGITTNVSGRDMNESEENIVAKGGIIRTTDVRVEIVNDGRSDEESVRHLKFDS